MFQILSSKIKHYKKLIHPAFSTATNSSTNGSNSTAAHTSSYTPFKLTSNFITKYKHEIPPFGFNGLGELVYKRTYSRPTSNGKFEEWADTIERVVNATFNMQKKWIEEHNCGWDALRAQLSAQEMFRRIFYMKFLPPGRGLWAMGSPLTEERGLYAALNNCAFVSTANFKEDPSKPFIFLMDNSMLGVGVGFDVQGANTFSIKGPSKSTKTKEIFIVPDSREGWVQTVKYILDAYFLGHKDMHFDFSLIRPPGTPIKGFGGTSSGPEILKTLVSDLRNCLDSEIGKPISITTITNIFNLIGKAVVAGNVRQTAEIAFGPAVSEYLDLKDYSVSPKRADFGWVSNNSIFAQLGMDYAPVVDRIVKNGEPGLAWLDNMRNYGRLGDAPNNKDRRAMGGNPCLEQTLESFEMCCLVETFPNNHESVEDYIKTLRYAFLYAKTVTLGRTHWTDTNRVMLRNRRIGVSMSGLAQFLAKFGINELKRWCELSYQAIQNYDEEYSEWLAIPRSIKMTSIKPSGTVSLLAGATPGMHFPQSRFYIRRVRFAKTSNLLQPLIAAGFPVEPSVNQPETTVVVEFPIDSGSGIRTEDSMSMWEQLSFAAFLQKHWADNQVSCTVSFNPQTEAKQLGPAIQYFQYQLKGISFLPRIEKGAYPQMPLESIDETEYKNRLSKLTLPLKFGDSSKQDAPIIDRFCDSDTCQLTSNSNT